MVHPSSPATAPRPVEGPGAASLQEGSSRPPSRRPAVRCSNVRQAGAPRRGAAAVLLSFALAASLSLAGCTPAPEPDDGADPPSSSSSATGTGLPTTIPTGTGIGTLPGAEATAAQWKTFRDAAGRIAFELPADWTAQEEPPGTSDPAGALSVVVRNAAGTVMATFGASNIVMGGSCADAGARDYTVLASVPMDIPSTSDDPGSISPRFVYRLMHGDTVYTASYGIVDHAAGADGRACLFYNVVTAQPLGVYWFGDVRQFSALPGGAEGLRTFTTLAEAQAYMLTGEFQNIARMITSLKVA
ncbi:hypothetical protein [Arthrobacter sp. 35W]|uniref:hypothetical protein n=1 Tax=Arthrobacter sp. 35W TaxID=1132441 RepID=UPI0004116468|nr:hypothetical protein [Arthrobacter sp. 35W]